MKAMNVLRKISNPLTRGLLNISGHVGSGGRESASRENKNCLMNVHKAQDMGNRMQNLNDMEAGKVIEAKRYIHRMIKDQRDDWVKGSEKYQQILRGC